MFKMGRKCLTNEQFIERSRKIHGDKFDLSKVEYKNNSTKVIIICPQHGEFEQIPNHHMNGRGCKKCDIHKRRSTKDEFIKQSKEVHGDKFDISKVEYKNNS